MQNLVKIGQSAVDLLHIFDFQNGGRPPSWISKFSQFLSKIQIIIYFYVHMQNLVKIGWSSAELLRIFDFHNGSRPPSWIFIFSQIFVKNLNLRLILCPHVKFCEDQMIRSRVIAYFHKMAVVRHLGFGVTSYRTTHDLCLMVLTSS